MKKRLFTLLATMLLIFAFSVTCFAKSSPTPSVLPTEAETSKPGNGGGGGNASNTSPKTGVDLAGAFVAVITAAGVALVSKKKFSEAN